MTRRYLLAVAAVGLLAVIGCGPAKQTVDRKFDLSGEKPAVAFELPPQSAAQSVKVDVTADNAVDVYVLTGVSADVAVNMDEKEVKAKSKSSSPNTKADTLTVQVPAGQAVTVWVGRSATVQKASGSVKLSN